MGYPVFPQSKYWLLHIIKKNIYKGGKNWLRGEKNGPAQYFPREKTDWREIPACYTGAGADSSQGKKLWCQQKCVVTSEICC